MNVGVVTDRGGSNKENEDSFLIDKNRGLFIVADGLGGHNAGKCASSIATEEIALYLKGHLVSDRDVRPILEQAILHANTAIVRAAEADPESRTDMGSTVVMGLFLGNRFFVSNVGDSRAYLIRNDSIEQLSEDHTFVAEWVKEGIITAQEARTHEGRRGLWMALGVEGDVEPYVVERSWNSDSCLLLCSDGLTDVVEDHEILKLAQSSKNPQTACENLLRRAKQQGTRDHVTVVLVCGHS